VADLPEDDGCDSLGSTDITTQFGCVALAEAGVPVDAYFLVPSEVEDLLENALGDSPDGLDTQIDDEFDNSLEFGVDLTEPDITDVEPPQVTTGGIFVWNPVDLGAVPLPDETIMFESLDPDLASGDDPSGVEDGSCGATCADDDLDLNLIEGELLANPLPADDGATLPASNLGLGVDMFELDFCGTLTNGCARVLGVGPSDGAYTVEIRSSDKAVKENNVGVAELTFELDVTPPGIDPFNPFPPSTSANAPLQFNLGGSVTDPNLNSAVVEIFSDSGANNCGTTAPGDLTPLVVPTEVDVQSIDITATASNFLVAFIVQNQAPGTIRYCLIVTGDDTAAFKDGTANPNVSTLFTAPVITWQ
jgi:hypothetical protein